MDATSKQPLFRLCNTDLSPLNPSFQTVFFLFCHTHTQAKLYHGYNESVMSRTLLKSRHATSTAVCHTTCWSPHRRRWSGLHLVDLIDFHDQKGIVAHMPLFQKKSRGTVYGQNNARLILIKKVTTFFIDRSNHSKNSPLDQFCA